MSMADSSFRAPSQSAHLFSVVWVGKEVLLMSWVQLIQRYFLMINVGKNSGMEVEDKDTSTTRGEPDLLCLYP